MQYALLVGFTITLLDVTDLDEGTNGQLTYEVVTPVRDKQTHHAVTHFVHALSPYL